jgi:LmbE family N-acetylglucosaminyl deacetylase
MPLALFLSPHLDDVVFSCGGLAASLAAAGWDTVLATAFTRSVVPATGFALACQLDKGLSPELDYMALRRAEDEVAAGLLGFGTNRWLNLLEAPHRGYEAAAELFGAIQQSDSVFLELAAHFIALSAEFQPDLVLAPQGLGNHVDHQQVVLAAGRSFPADRVAYYRDTPYAIRALDAAALPAVPAGVGSTVPIGDVLDRKIAAAQAYASQIGFQFGGPAPLARALSDFALREGNGQAAERFCGSSVAGALQSLAA